MWLLLIYRLPAKPSRARVAVWRELRRLGTLPLQQGVVAAPELGDLPDRLRGVEQRITQEGGTSYRFRLEGLDESQDARLREEWSALRRHEYAEIVEECESKFAREIEFEIFRANFTGSEAEELEADLEKIRAWYGRVVARDWFDAPHREEARRAVANAEALLDDFLERVYEAERDGPSLEPPLDLPWGETGLEPPAAVVDIGPSKRRRRRPPS